jgi:four helix bundle protein
MHDLPRFAGWWGHRKETRFLMGSQFDVMPGAEGWQVSNPPILPLAALRASMEIFDEARMDRLRAKSRMLSGYAEFLLGQLSGGRFRILTPRDPEERGAQLSIRFQTGGRQVLDALRESGVICDWREPDVIRIAPVPLYNSFLDVFVFARIIKEILTEVRSAEYGERSTENGPEDRIGRMTVVRFEDLDVWKESMGLAKNLFREMRHCRTFSLKDQVERSAISIPSNIAEGFDRKSNKEFIQHLYIAKGSCSELRTQLHLCKDLKMIQERKADDYIELTRKISSMLYRLIRTRISQF